MKHYESMVRRCVLLGVAGAVGLVLALAGVARAQENKARSGEVNSGDKAKAMEYLMTPTVKLLPKVPLPAKNSTAAKEAEMKPYSEALPGSELSFDMVPIKGGKFRMGSPASEKKRKADEGPQVEVAIEPFWMGKCEVTWDEYETWQFRLDAQRRKANHVDPTPLDKVADLIVRPTNPYTDMSFGMGKEGRPAVCMTQYAAQTYCKWLSAKTGRYYRLPTEAEWEYACRAGSKTAYSFGDDPKQLGDYAWYADNSSEKYHKVGTKKPNAWGLYDMYGNVNEWTLDQYAVDSYKKLAAAGKTVKEPYVVATKEFPRVVRGGSWDDDAEACRSAARRGSTKDWKMQDPQIPQSIWYLTDATFVGFRVIRPLRTPGVEECKAYDPDPKVALEYRKAQGGKE
jgi:formylglycine-generating enzyme required for sulfatase activity